MSLTQENIKKIANLARLKMSDDEINKYCGELNKIFSWIDMLNEVNTSDIEPLRCVNNHHSTPTRSDVVSDGEQQMEVLANTKDSKYGYFVVPKVIE